jgi:hypothetical protein
VTNLKWQLKIAEHLVKAGSLVEIIDRWQSEGRVFLKLREIGSGNSSPICVKSNINIGGKNYLLFEEVNAADNDFTVARLIDKERLCAMDPDRFSSLSNALTAFAESDTLTTLPEFEKILGALPSVPSRQVEH